MKRPSRLIERIKHSTGIDRAIAFSVVGRGWSAFAGIVSVTLIARYLSAGQQGYYYTFSSLVALQIIFELGFSFVILQLAAHERANLTIYRDGRIEGSETSRARMASVLQKAVRWYAVAAICMAIILLIVGFRFFSKENASSGVHWQLPWIVVVLATSITFQIDPIISFLEGCGKVVEVGRLRLSQGILGSLFSWAAIMLHGGLFSPALIICGQAIAGSFFLYQNRFLLMTLMKLDPGVHAIKWSTEIWPFQWRVAVSWASAYFIWQVMNPILFAYRGPVEAGRLGMSLSIANSLGALGLAWMSTKAAPFGVLIARRRFAELDQLFFRALKQSTAILLAGITFLMGALVVLFHFFPAFKGRVLPLPYFGIILLTTGCSHIVVSSAYYLRAHKKEPFLFFWVAIALISGLSLLWLARVWGTPGVVFGYFICSGVLRMFAAIYVFFKKRREWHVEIPLILATSAD
jgi:hypothetical protein